MTEDEKRAVERAAIERTRRVKGEAGGHDERAGSAERSRAAREDLEIEGEAPADSRARRLAGRTWDATVGRKTGVRADRED